MHKLTARFAAVLAMLLAGAALVAAGASGQDESGGEGTPGSGTELDYQNCLIGPPVAKSDSGAGD